MKIAVRFSELEEELQKSYINRSHLVRKQKQVIRNGKAVNTYVWVNPEKDKTKSKYKAGLKTTDQITDYLEKELKNMGFKVKADYSNLSDSHYLTLENFTEITGKESKYNGEELKIRISGHDLPPSYDGLHGYHDLDVMSNGKQRPGNDGKADYYENVLSRIEAIVKPEIKQKQQEKVKNEKRETHEMSKKLPEWINSDAGIKAKKDKVKSIDSRMFLNELLNGGSWNNYKKPTKDQRIRKLSNFMNELAKPENADARKLYSDLIENETENNSDSELDNKYLAAIKSGNMELVQKMVTERAIEKGFKDAIPEQGNGYKIRTTRPPKKTRTCYKCFYVDEKGRPSALFVDNNAALPTNVWLNANDTYHFKAANGKNYVPTMGNDTNKDAGKTGIEIKIPDEKTRQELIERGYLPAGSKAKNITCVAYRPGWHGGDLPFFPQGGKYGNHELTQNGDVNRKYNPDLPNSPYKNVHRWNQVIFEIEIDADKDYTPEARAQKKAWSKKGTFIPDNADLQYMPEGGSYEYTTNPEVEQMTGGKGKWLISGSIKIKRALTEKECNEMLKAVGLPYQEWEARPDFSKTKKERDAEKLNLAALELDKLGYTGTELSAARKTLAPITYDDNGEIIPLSKRFDSTSNDIRKSF